jgi:hypothetical protein
MRAVTTIESENDLALLNALPMDYLRTRCVVRPMKLDINNGCITGATITHRDFVSVYDGRNNYIEQERMVNRVTQ